MKKSFSQTLINAPYILWSALFIVVPLVIVVYFTFVNSQGEFTLEYLSELPEYADILLRSVLYALVATVITLLLAYPFAYFMSTAKARTQGLMMMLIMLPMWMNLLIRTYSWTTILEKTGIINTLLSKVGIGHFNLSVQVAR